MGEPGALHLYRELRERGLRPALLESLGSRTAFARRTVLGRDPVRRLEVWDGRLYEDGSETGAAQDILARLELPARTSFFPAWIGFFTYEFARHLGLPTNGPMAGLPEAAFYLYPDGYLWRTTSWFTGLKVRPTRPWRGARIWRPSQHERGWRSPARRRARQTWPRRRCRRSSCAATTRTTSSWPALRTCRNASAPAGSTR